MCGSLLQHRRFVPVAGIMDLICPHLQLFVFALMAPTAHRELVAPKQTRKVFAEVKLGLHVI